MIGKLIRDSRHNPQHKYYDEIVGANNFKDICKTMALVVGEATSDAWLVHIIGYGDITWEKALAEEVTE